MVGGSGLPRREQKECWGRKRLRNAALAILFHDFQMLTNAHQTNKIHAKTEEHVWILSADSNANALLTGQDHCATKVVAFIEKILVLSLNWWRMKHFRELY